jgi:tRNA pseudouridine(55) synthase
MFPYNTQKHAQSQDKEGVFTIYKAPGETLAMLVERFRSEQSLDPKVPITYAGRLDPMADGLVLLLVGETCKEKDSFLGLDKTYTFEVLFGVSADTFDMLGLIDETKESIPIEEEIKTALLEIKNKTLFSYPPFSSKPVDGTPLFMHAKAGTLPDELPKIKGEIKSILFKNVRTENFKDVVEKSIEIINTVEGDFRQKEIVEGWIKFLGESKNEKCVIATCEATVSSGVYIRSIAVELGKTLDTPALAYSITRTSIGKYLL